jgi:hypothetical protein
MLHEYRGSRDAAAEQVPHPLRLGKPRLTGIRDGISIVIESYKGNRDPGYVGTVKKKAARPTKRRAALRQAQANAKVEADP